MSDDTGLALESQAAVPTFRQLALLIWCIPEDVWEVRVLLMAFIWHGKVPVLIVLNYYRTMVAVTIICARHNAIVLSLITFLFT